MDQKDFQPLNKYFPYWTYKGSRKVRNPKADDVTENLLNLKHSERPTYPAAVRLFTSQLVSYLARKSLDPHKTTFAIVPSSEALKVSRGLVEISAQTTLELGLASFNNPIERTKTIAKLATGGARNRFVHESSIRIDPLKLQIAFHYLLLDDISSTRNSLEVCADLLLANGASKVSMISLGQTSY